MATLAEILLTPEVRPRVVADSVRLIDEEVASKGGLTGIAIKGAYAVVKALKANIIPETVDALLDGFVARIEPFYVAWSKAPGTSFAAHLEQRASEVADALLAITDERAQRTQNATLRKAYEKLRPMGKKQVEAALPRVARMVGRYIA
jgi:uncharacterized protein (DUF2267 family)